jgi:RHS repeat-associated protein
MVDNTQAVAVSYAYDPFGHLQMISGALDQPFKFSTKPYDQTTGLSDYGHRFYSPLLGRWTARDPIAERGSWNLYEFVAGNPINFVDQLGLWTFSIGLGASFGSGDGWANSATITVSSSDAFGDQIGWTLTHSEGSIFGAMGGFGAVFSCSGNRQISDLSGTSVTSGGSFGPFSFDISSATSSSVDPAYTLSVAKSFGAATYYLNSDTATGMWYQKGGYGTPTP